QAGENKAREIVFVLREHPFLERLLPSDRRVAAVADAIFAYNDEDHVLAPFAKQPSRLHEDVEAAHALHAAGNIGDDLDIVGNEPVAYPPRDLRLWPPEIGVD